MLITTILSNAWHKTKSCLNAQMSYLFDESDKTAMAIVVICLVVACFALFAIIVLCWMRQTPLSIKTNDKLFNRWGMNPIDKVHLFLSFGKDIIIYNLCLISLYIIADFDLQKHWLFTSNTISCPNNIQRRTRTSFLTNWQLVSIIILMKSYRICDQ